MPRSATLRRLLTSFILAGWLVGCQPTESTPPQNETTEAATHSDARPVAALIEQLNSQDNAEQAAAAALLARIGANAAPAVDALAAQLEDDDPHVRAHSARALGLSGNAAKRAAQSLAKLITDEDETVRRAAIHALNRIKPGQEMIVPLMQEALGSADPHVVALATHSLAEVGADIVPSMIQAMEDEGTVYWAILVLAELGPEAKDAVTSLSKALVHEDEEVRHEAAQALRAIGPGAVEAIPQLTAALGDECVQMPAALALGNIGPPAKAAIESLRRISQDADDVLQICAMWALANIEDDNEKMKTKTAPALVEFLVSDDQEVRRAAALALLQLEPGAEVMAPLISQAFENASDEARADMIDAVATLGAAAVPRMIAALEYPAIREQAVETLGRLGPDAVDAVPALLNYINDDDPELRADILTTLGHIGPAAKEAVNAVMGALDDKDEEVVVSAVFALGKIGPESVDCAKGIKGLLDSGNPRFQTVCAWALVKVMPEDEEYRKIALPLLIKALEHDEDSVRSEAASTLGAIGSAAKGAAAKLKDLASNDSNSDVRELAAEALQAIGQ